MSTPTKTPFYPPKPDIKPEVPPEIAEHLNHIYDIHLKNLYDVAANHFQAVNNLQKQIDALKASNGSGSK